MAKKSRKNRPVTADDIAAQRAALAHQRAVLNALIAPAPDPPGISPETTVEMMGKAFTAGQQTAARQEYPGYIPPPGAGTPGRDLALDSAKQAMRNREPLNPNCHQDPMQRPGAFPSTGTGLPSSSTRLLSPAGTPDRAPGPLGSRPHIWQ